MGEVKHDLSKTSCSTFLGRWFYNVMGLFLVEGRLDGNLLPGFCEGQAVGVSEKTAYFTDSRLCRQQFAFDFRLRYWIFSNEDKME